MASRSWTPPRPLNQQAANSASNVPTEARHPQKVCRIHQTFPAALRENYSRPALMFVSRHKVDQARAVEKHDKHVEPRRLTVRRLECYKLDGCGNLDTLALGKGFT